MTLEEEIKRAENKLYYELPKKKPRLLLPRLLNFLNKEDWKLSAKLIENTQTKNYEFCRLDYFNYNSCNDWN